MEPAEEHALAEQWLQAWNSHKLEPILELYAEDIEFESPYVEAIMGYATGFLKGKKDLRLYFQKALEGYPGLNFQLIEIFTGVDGMLLLYHSIKGKIAAETMKFDANKKIRRVTVHYARDPKSEIWVVPPDTE